MPILHRLIRPFALLAALSSATPSGAQVTRIENTATISYGSGAGAVSVSSNTVSLLTQRTKQPTTVQFLLAPNGFSTSAMRCTRNPSTVTPAPVSAEDIAAAKPLGGIDLSQPTLVVVTDPGGNHDPDVREQDVVEYAIGTLSGTMLLTETAPNSGVFAGGVAGSNQEAAQADCDLSPFRGQRLLVHFPENDFSYGSSSDALIDPAGYVFDSETGVLVDGATIAIVDATGAPAQVFGVDAQSAYPSTVISGQAVTDASGRGYPAMKGRYWFPKLRPGTYRLLITPPATYTAPSVKTPDHLTLLVDDHGRRFVIADPSYGRSFNLVDSDLVADIPLDPHGSDELLLTKSASVRQASPGDFVEYRLQLRNRGKATRPGLHLADYLPTGLRYRAGSTRGAAEPAIATDARNLDFTLPAVPAMGTLDLRYVVSIAPGAPVGEALNRARALDHASPVSNEAAASVRIQPLLFTDAMTVIGRVTEGDCNDPARGRKGVGGIRILLEDGTFTVTDRDGLYHVEGVRPGRHVVQLDTASVPASHEPVACDIDTRQAGSATSRFVEGVGGIVKRVDFQLRATGRAVAVVDALPITSADDATAAAGNRDWLAGQQPGIAWLFPEADHNPRTPTIRVAIKHAPGQRVALSLEGQPVDPLSFDTTDTGGAVAISRWTGIPLHAGDNHLSARVLGADGQLAATLTRIVHVSGAPIHAEFDGAHSRLVADGLTRPLIAVRLTDAAGRPVRAGTAVPFTVDQPYRAAIDVARDQARAVAGQAGLETLARVVGDDGIAFAALQPTTQAGAARVTLAMTEDKTLRTSTVRAWLAGARREWTVVGFGAGSIGYQTLAAHSRSLGRGSHDLVTDGQLALYAKGRIKGSWLLTLAYDSDRAFDPDRGLLGTIDPDRYYTVYGDGSAQGYDAATRRKLYLRLERREFYALFGDFETAMADTQLARYSRTLSGVKAAYEGERLRATGFAAETDSLHVRDEIRGNGLSGPYRLSGRGIVPNSDKLVIEVRDRYRSERILSQTAMTRHIDYDIDTILGTVRFRAPVLSRDPDGNPIFITVDFEVAGGRAGKLAAAGRVVGRMAGGKVELGASAIRDETAGVATIVAADIKARITPATELRAEVASGGKGGLKAGQAFIAEAEHHGAGVDVLAYVRQQDVGFGVGQQNAVEAGTRKIGVDGRVALTDRLSLAGTAWQQVTLGTPGTRTAADLRLEYKRQQGTLFVGAQLASDRGVDGEDRDSRLLTLGGTQSLLGGKLTVAGQTQVAPGGDKGSVDFPIRHQITAGYQVATGVRLIGGYEIADGKDYGSHTAQVGFDIAPWAGAKLTSTMNQQASGENGMRTFAQYGLTQSLPVGKHWTLDATFDAASTVRGAATGGSLVNPLQTTQASGLVGQDALGGDFYAATVGANYRGPRWSWNGRLEYRHADAGTRWGVTTNMLRTLGEGRTVAASGKFYSVRDRAGAVASYAAGDVALALRPLDSRWSVLERFSLRHERADTGFDDSNVLGVPATGLGDQVTGRAINNLALNYRTGAEGQGHGFEATVYYGAKYVRGRYQDDTYTGFIDVIGFDLRRDLGKHLDIGVEGSVQHAWNAGAWSWSAGPSVGASPAKNLWLSAGFNIAGYRDRDFEDDRYTRAGPYLTMRLKFDQQTLAGATRALIGRGR